MSRRVSLLVCGAALAALALATQAPPVAAQITDDYDAMDDDFGMKLRHPAAYRNELNVYPRSHHIPPRWNYEFFDHPKPSFQYFQQGGLTLKSGWGLTSLGLYGYRDCWWPGYCPIYGPDYYAPPACRPWGRCHGR